MLIECRGLVLPLHACKALTGNTFNRLNQLITKRCVRDRCILATQAGLARPRWDGVPAPTPCPDLQCFAELGDGRLADSPVRP